MAGRSIFERCGRGALGRRLCVLGLSALFVSCACSSRPPPAYPLRWARAWIDSLNHRRWEWVGPLLAEGATYEDPLWNGPLDRTAAAFYWSYLWRRFPELRYELTRVTGDGRTVAVEWTVHFSDMTPPSTGIFILTVEGDALASVRGYFNAAPFLFPFDESE